MLYQVEMCMERSILHSDLNNFYASVECLYNPGLQDKPVAVCGSQEERHGIVLAKNQFAKKPVYRQVRRPGKLSRSARIWSLSHRILTGISGFKPNQENLLRDG